MKSYNVDHKLKDKELIHIALMNVCKGKKKRNDKGEISAKYQIARRIMKHPEHIEEVIYTAITEFEQKQHAIHTGTYRPGMFPNAFKPSMYTVFYKVCDNGKCRKLTNVQSFVDQTIHRLLREAGEEALLHYMHPHTCGSIKGRGTHRAAKYIKRFIKQSMHHDKTRIKYFTKLDMTKFFPHIDHRRLKSLIDLKFKGHLFKDLCFTIIDSYCEPGSEEWPIGIPIGFDTSPLFGNLYLTALDYYISQICKGQCFVRYIDDMIFFNRNKKQAHFNIRNIINCANMIGTPIKGNWQISRFDYVKYKGIAKEGKKDRRRGRDVDILGYRFFRDKTILRKRNSLKIRRQARRIGKAKYIAPSTAKSFMSRIGALKHCDSKTFYRDCVKPNVNIKHIKEIIANESRKLSKTEPIRIADCA